MICVSELRDILLNKSDNIDLFTLEQIVEQYPYFEMARLIYLKRLKQVDNEIFINKLRASAAYFSNRKFAHAFVNDIAGKSASAEIYDTAVISTDYFALKNSNVSSDSLRELARRLKKSRIERLRQQSEDVITEADDDEIRVKKLILDKRYVEALRILKKINLNNSIKNTYFALQIKYLETILDSTE